VSPSLYRQDIELLVVALQYEAEIQKQQGIKKARQFALRAVGAAAIVGIVIAASASGFEVAA